MAVFTWNNSYSVKVAVCDEQHMKLFDIINQLADAMRMGKAQDVVNSVVTELLDYTNIAFFRKKKRWMRETNYPLLDGAAHGDAPNFVKKVQSLQSQAQMGKRIIRCLGTRV